MSALLLHTSGQVGTDTIFYNQLARPDDSARHGAEQALCSADLSEELLIDLPAVLAHV